MSQGKQEDVSVELLAESESFAVLRTRDIDGEVVYNIELGSVTLHLFQEEWDELLDILTIARGA